jgi:hypothetical protein
MITMMIGIGESAVSSGATTQRQGNGAILSGRYRYLLWRTWDETRPRLLWVLLNPNTADEQTDDPTLRRCIRFSREWQYGGLEIVNLFAFRTPHPHDLHRAADPIGSENDQYLATAAARAAGIILAWGEKGTYLQRDRAVLALLSLYSTQPLYCLGIAHNGCPRHPLYRPGSTRPVPYQEVGPLLETCLKNGTRSTHQISRSASDFDSYPFLAIRVPRVG